MHVQPAPFDGAIICFCSVSRVFYGFACLKHIRAIAMPMAAGDLITQLQECNAELCAHLFNFTGAIQRDAPPLSVGEEPLEASHAASAGVETVAQTPELAAQVHMGAIKGVFQYVQWPLLKLKNDHILPIVPADRASQQAIR